jgi:hypothetical protein
MKKTLDAEKLRNRIRVRIQNSSKDENMYSRGMMTACECILADIDILTQLTFEDLSIGDAFQTNQGDTYIKTQCLTAVCIINVSNYNAIGDKVQPVSICPVELVFLEVRKKEQK